MKTVLYFSATTLMAISSCSKEDMQHIAKITGTTNTKVYIESGCTDCQSYYNGFYDEDFRGTIMLDYHFSNEANELTAMFFENEYSTAILRNEQPIDAGALSLNDDAFFKIAGDMSLVYAYTMNETAQDVQARHDRIADIPGTAINLSLTGANGFASFSTVFHVPSMISLTNPGPITTLSRAQPLTLTWIADAIDLGVAVVIMPANTIDSGDPCALIFAADDGSLALDTKYFNGIPNGEVNINIYRMRFSKINPGGVKYKIQCRMYDGLTTLLTD